MAKKVTVTWTDPSPTTNVDHLEIWRKTGVGGTYAQIGADISLAAANSYEDTNGGSGLTDATTYYYQVRAYNSTGDYSNIEASITISAASASETGIYFNTDYIQTTFQAASITDFEMTLGAAPETLELVMACAGIGYETSGWAIQVSTTNLNYVRLRANAAFTADYGPVTKGTKIRILKETDGVSLFLDDVLKTKVSFSTSGFKTTTNQLIIGSFFNGQAYTRYKLNSFKVNTEVFACDEGTGSTTTGSLGTVLTISGTPAWYTE